MTLSKNTSNGEVIALQAQLNMCPEMRSQKRQTQFGPNNWKPKGNQGGNNSSSSSSTLKKAINVSRCGLVKFNIKVASHSKTRLKLSVKETRSSLKRRNKWTLSWPYTTTKRSEGNCKLTLKILTTGSTKMKMTTMIQTNDNNEQSEIPNPNFEVNMNKQMAELLSGLDPHASRIPH